MMPSMIFHGLLLSRFKTFDNVCYRCYFNHYLFFLPFFFFFFFFLHSMSCMIWHNYLLFLVFLVFFCFFSIAFCKAIGSFFCFAVSAIVLPRFVLNLTIFVTISDQRLISIMFNRKRAMYPP